MIHLAILGSTRGTHLTTLVSAISEGRLDAEIKVVLSNQEQTGILDRARTYGLTAEYVPVLGAKREEYDRRVDAVLNQYSKIDLIVLIGYMRILSSWFVQRWNGRIINIHPSLLPRHRGLMDLAVHQAVLDAGEPETGCTAHLVVDEVDAGPILQQNRVVVCEGETAETLKKKVQAIEGACLISAIQKWKPL